MGLWLRSGLGRGVGKEETASFQLEDRTFPSGEVEGERKTVEEVQ